MTTHVISIAGQKNQIVEGDPFATIEDMRSRLPKDEPWTKLAVWKLADGDWYAVRFRDHQAPIEPEFVAEAQRIRLDDEAPIYGGPKDAAEAEARQIYSVMRFFEWSWLAKNLADKMGWPTAENVEART